MQTILGAGGAIGVHLADELREYTSKIRLVSRNPKSGKGDEEIIAADMFNPEDAYRAVKGSNIAYLTIGLNYDHKVWEKKWPVIMENVIQACKEYQSCLVFFDNNYMYDPDHISHMTEETPIHPSGPKGKVRARIARRVLEANENGDIRALIARAADFYGPLSGENSVLNELVFKPLLLGKKASWPGTDDKKHSCTYTPDAARATALLGNTESAYGKVWHLPTAADPPTGREWIEKIAKQLDQTPRYRVLSSWMLSLAGIFDKKIREFKEISYQYEDDYVFDSSKFIREFEMSPTGYEEGIVKVIETDYSTVDT